MKNVRMCVAKWSGSSTNNIAMNVSGTLRSRLQRRLDII